MSDIIHINLPDGSTLEVPKGTTALQIAKSLSPRLAEAALAAKIAPLSGNGGSPASHAEPAPTDPAKNGDLIDLARPLEQDLISKEGGTLSRKQTVASETAA